MGAIRKRKIDEDRKLGTFWRPPKQVTVLGLMCEKMAERALAAQEKAEEREAAHALASVTSAVVDMEDEDENADEPKLSKFLLVLATKDTTRCAIHMNT